MPDTIFALSSGSPPAAIAILRVSGPGASDALAALTGSVPQSRTPSLRTIRGAAGEVLDRALVLWMPGPSTATGEDLAELHCHGGRAVVRAVERALAAVAGLRRAEPGEFTRRAFLNGRIDLAEAEGLADLLAAETEIQRQAAQAAFGGAISRQVDHWRERVLMLSAQVEAALDFSDEGDVDALPESFGEQLRVLREEIATGLARPSAERLRDGVRVVLAGPPNSGKSSLFNALLQDAAAIVSPMAGTTRDAIERPVALRGVPLVLVDTAGLREDAADAIESEGIGRARTQLDRADIVLWLGPEGQGPQHVIEVQARADLEDSPRKKSPDHVVSSVTGMGMTELEASIADRALALLPKPGEAAFGARQRAVLSDVGEELGEAEKQVDPLVVGEHLRRARVLLDRILGRSSTEDMLDALFGRFCIGK